MNQQLLNKIFEEAKIDKEASVTKSLLAVGHPPDICPTLYAVTDNEIILKIKSPSVDKKFGLFAAHVVHDGAVPDSVVLIFDAFMSMPKIQDTVRKLMSGEQESLNLSEMAKNGGIAKEEVAEILVFIICDYKNRAIQSFYIPYTKRTGRVEWKESQNFPQGDVGGSIHNALVETMKSIPLIDKPEVQQGAFALGIVERDRQIFHTSRAVVKLLEGMDFSVEDRFSHKHPEWTDNYERN